MPRIWNGWITQGVVQTPVTTGGSYGFLYDQHKSTLTESCASQRNGYHPEVHNAEKWCKLIEVSVSAEIKIAEEADKRLKERGCGGSTVIVGAALGAMPPPHSIKGNSKKN